MYSIRKINSRPSREGVMTHYASIRAEAESPDALVALLTAETNGVAGVLSVPFDIDYLRLVERTRERDAARAEADKASADLEKLKAELAELRPRSERQADSIRQLLTERDGLVQENELLEKQRYVAISEADKMRARLSDKSAALLVEMLGEGEWSAEAVCAAIREALSILRPELLRG